MAKQAPDTDKGRNTVRDQTRFGVVVLMRLLWYGWVWGCEVKNESQYTHYKKLDYTTGYLV